MNKYITDEVVYSTGAYEVRKFDTILMEEDGVDLSDRANWGIVNRKHGTIEQYAYVLSAAVNAAKELTAELDSELPSTEPALTLAH